MKPMGKMTACYAVGWNFFRAYFSVYHRYRVFNVERVPLQGPVILASNHASYIDPPLVGTGVRRQINYLARDSIFRVPILASILRSWEVVPVDRDGGTGRGLKAILDRLACGGAIILFPEGAFRHRAGGDQVRRAGRAGAGFWDVSGLRRANARAAAATAGCQVWPATAV